MDSAPNPIQSFRDLDVWQVSMELVVVTYALAGRLPGEERFHLGSQMRRSAVSIPSNIAEGHARRGGAYRNHVLIALGSIAELGTLLDVGGRLGFFTPEDTDSARNLVQRVGSMLTRLSIRLRRRRIVAANAVLPLLAGTLSCFALGLL